MAEPYKDTRKGRDRAAYMRDYRAGRKKIVPTIEALAARIAALETMLAKLPHGQTFVVNDEVHVVSDAALAEAAQTGKARSAPKGK